MRKKYSEPEIRIERVCFLEDSLTPSKPQAEEEMNEATTPTDFDWGDEWLDW